MMFRRLRSSPKKLVAFRVVAFLFGLLYLVVVTDTPQILRTAFNAIEKLEEARQLTLGNEPTLTPQDK